MISGDTRYNANVIKYGAGADLLVHEVAAARPELMREAYIQRIVAHHVTPREAGRVFAQAKPKPTRAEIVEHMSSNLCRCGTYQRIVRAVERAAREA